MYILILILYKINSVVHCVMRRIHKLKEKEKENRDHCSSCPSTTFVGLDSSSIGDDRQGSNGIGSFSCIGLLVFILTGANSING